jgi:hypothetical protein
MTGAVVFIAYPAEFLSRKKFFRKMSLYTASLVIDSIVAVDDPNGFSSAFSESVGASFNLDASAVAACTHGVIFSHGKGFQDAVEELKNRGVPGKVIPVQLATVANKDRGEPFDIYIGRGTVWGNPYPIGPAGDREEVLRKYRYDFDRRLLRFFEDEENNVKKIFGKVLGCHCKPAACHGDILAAYVNSLDDGE